MMQRAKDMTSNRGLAGLANLLGGQISEYAKRLVSVVSPDALARWEASKQTPGICSDQGVSEVSCVVTGANTGIGYYTAEYLAKVGFHVILACRSTVKAEAAVDAIKTATGNSRVEYMHLDLSSLASVRKFASDISKRGLTLKLLVNNGGAIMGAYSKTHDGMESTFQTNHVSHFLLTKLLEPQLIQAAPSRVVIVSSIAHTFSDQDTLLQDPNFENHSFSELKAYGNSKMANLLHAKKLATLLGDKGVEVFAVHPGAVYSDFYRAETSKLAHLVFRLSMKSSSVGARTQIWASVAPVGFAPSGSYLADCSVVSPLSSGTGSEEQQRLWDITETMIAQHT